MPRNADGLAGWRAGWLWLGPGADFAAQVGEPVELLAGVPGLLRRPGRLPVQVVEVDQSLARDPDAASVQAGEREDRLVAGVGAEWPGDPQLLAGSGVIAGDSW